jgi:hypothetical protein
LLTSRRERPAEKAKICSGITEGEENKAVSEKGWGKRERGRMKRESKIEFSESRGLSNKRESFRQTEAMRKARIGGDERVEQREVTVESFQENGRIVLRSLELSSVF